MFLVQLRYLTTANLRIKWKISSQLAQTPYSAWIFQRNDPSATLSPIAVMKKSCFMWLAAPFLDYVQTILHLTLDSLSILLYPVLFFMRVISGNIFLFLVRFNNKFSQHPSGYGLMGGEKSGYFLSLGPVPRKCYYMFSC